MEEAEEWGETASQTRMNSRNPLDKYTNDDMKPVHYNHPTAALRNIDPDILGSWEAIQTGKLLAQPFGAYASKAENHNGLKALIFAAVVEITDTTNISVCAPRRKPNSPKNPTSFLIHNLTEKQRQTLLVRSVWSSTDITFRVLPFEPACPNFLFSIKGFTTGTEDTVKKAVESVWEDETTETFLNSICNQIPEKDRTIAAQTLRDFINSMWVTMLKTRLKGSFLAPTFQVYAIGGMINNDRTWCRLRSYFASRNYVVPLEDPGITTIPTADNECSICHGADHPRGLCPFQGIIGWNGPKGRDDEPLTDPITGKKIYGAQSTRNRNNARVDRA